MMRRNRPALFKGRHFEAEVIVLCVRWYLRFGLSFRNLEELMVERNVTVDHVTIWRWVQRYAPELDRRCRSELRMTNRSWRADETYLRIAGKWTYLYRAVDSSGDYRFSTFSEARCGCCQALLPESITVTKPSSCTSHSTWTGIPLIRALSMNSSGLENSVDAAAVGPFAI